MTPDLGIKIEDPCIEFQLQSYPDQALAGFGFSLSFHLLIRVLIRIQTSINRVWMHVGFVNIEGS